MGYFVSEEEVMSVVLTKEIIALLGTVLGGCIVAISSYLNSRIISRHKIKEIVCVEMIKNLEELESLSLKIISGESKITNEDKQTVICRSNWFNEAIKVSADKLVISKKEQQIVDAAKELHVSIVEFKKKLSSEFEVK